MGKKNKISVEAYQSALAKIGKTIEDYAIHDKAGRTVYQRVARDICAYLGLPDPVGLNKGNARAFINYFGIKGALPAWVHRLHHQKPKVKKWAASHPDKATPKWEQKPRNEWVKTEDFLRSYEWRKLRMKAILKYGRICACCGLDTVAAGVPINIDHIKPRRKYPELALDIDNLQPLCHDCNHGKGNWDETDWRKVA